MAHMDETRQDLAEKLEQLEKKVSDTVTTVTDLVEKVPETVSTVTDTVQHTVVAVKDTVEGTVDAVKGTVESTVRSVRHFFDVPRQVDRHPWLMLGGSVVLGFLGGRMLLPRRAPAALPPPSPAPEPPPVAPFKPYYTPAAEAAEAARARQEPQERAEEREEEPEAHEGLLNRLGEKFGDEIKQAKGLALGTLLGVARDMVVQWMPDPLKQDVKSVIDKFTADLGGKVFEKPILGGNGQPAEACPEEGARGQGETDDQSEEPEPHAATASTTTTARKGGRGRR
jgi:ElaB/YqjD/DUF883 family membrane-anchored ribosome-binding protein